MPTRDDAWPEGTPCWVDLSVDDPAAARQYYSELFGWDIQDGPEEAGGYLMALKGGRPAAGVGPKMGDPSTPSVWTTYLAADDADATAEKVTAAGGQVFMPPFDVMDVGRMTVAADSSGAAFGIWQAGAHAGAGIFNEDGAYTWNELHTRDFDGAKAFYAAVFGWTYDDFGDGEQLRYAQFQRPDGEGVGGINDDSLHPGDNPAYWLTWFWADDVVAATTKATELGGSVMMPPSETPFGHMAIVAGAQGEAFGLINPAQVTPPPAED